MHVVCDFVALCVGRRGRSGEGLVVGKLWVETDEEVVVVQAFEGAGEGGGRREVGYMVEGCG